MELKVLLVLAVLGVVSGFTIPEDKDVKFPSSYSEDAKSSTNFAQPEEEGVVRNKRHLMFKKYKKGKGDAVIINREYEQGVGYRPGREVHHHHHYGYPQPPSYTENRWEANPNREYHHYHGYNEGAYSNQGYYSNGYSGGYSNGGNYYSRPTYGQPPPVPSGPVSAAPAATGHNAVDRGQGAAAVNNIAIIHARAGSSTHTTDNNAIESESRTIPRPLPIDFDALSREALGLD